MTTITITLDENEFKVEGVEEVRSLKECFQLAFALKEAEEQAKASFSLCFHNAINQIVSNFEGIND